ncbi:hypothetical protein SETIT_1G281700v2 [Setaria italica]|uniref:Uncharacterized protein n=1 Tax=Setaria italica TaxID=4555 RepID=A0A368PQ59_SETIT|nr:hypothetical protein SETIT_1G281700v2 [Setaria italica]
MAASWKAATGKKDAAPSAPRPHCARDVLVFAAGVAAAVLAFLGLSSFVLVPGWRGGGGFAAFPVPGPADGPRTFYDDPDLSYALDCRITGWDAKRAAWLWSRGLGAGAAAVQEGRRGRPLVTCSFLKNKLDYCRLHGTELLYDNVLLEPSMATYWAKIPAVRAAILAHPDAEGGLWWVEADAVFTGMEFSLPLAAKYGGYNLWSLDFLDECWPSGNGRLDSASLSSAATAYASPGTGLPWPPPPLPRPCPHPRCQTPARGPPALAPPLDARWPAGGAGEAAGRRAGRREERKRKGATR